MFLENCIFTEKRLIFRNRIPDYAGRFQLHVDSRKETPVDAHESIEEGAVEAIQDETQEAAQLLSIIIPAYNEGNDNTVGPEHVRYHQKNPHESPVKKFLLYLMGLALPQGTEIIVVNNNSKDNTAECVTNFYRENENVLREKNIHFRFVNAVDQGVAHARNTGIYLAKGEYVLFLDADTEGFAVHQGTEKEFMLNALTEMENRQAQCATMPLKLGSGAKQDSSAEAAVNTVKDWLAGTNYPFITGSGTLCKRDMAVEVGGFRTDTIAEDVLFGKDVKKAGGKIIVLETGQITVDMRRETKNRSDGAQLAEQKFREYHEEEVFDQAEMVERLKKIRALGAEANVHFFNWSFLMQLGLYFGGKERFVAMTGYEDMLKHMGSSETYSTLDIIAGKVLSVSKNTLFDAIVRGEAVGRILHKRLEHLLTL